MASQNNWWKDIPNYGGKYQASRLGEVRRVFPSGKTRLLTPFRRKKMPTLYVKLTDRTGKCRDVKVLHIIADTYLCKPAGKDIVPYHLNGILSDNRADNIAFVTKQELGHITGGTTRKRKTVFKVDESGEVVEIYRSARAAAKANFMSYQTVLDRCHNKVKSPFALDGFTYQFEE